DLAERATGKLLPELNETGTLEIRQTVAQECVDVVARAGLAHDQKRFQLLARRAIRQSDHHRLGDRGHFFQSVLNLARVDFVASDVDEAASATVKVQRAVPADRPEIAGKETVPF